MARVNGKNKKRIVFTFTAIIVLMLLLAFRLAWIQVVKAEEYGGMATDQQTSDIPLEAKRGSIYDRNGEELATSAACYTVWARPAEIKENYPTAEKLGEVTSRLAVVLDMDAGEIEEKITKEQALIKVAKYLDKKTADKVVDLELSGISIAENTKRYYPLGNFASQLLGSVNDDNEGRTGVELQYDEYLSGVAGRWIKNTDINGNTLSYGEEKYYRAEDGLNVVLTIDEVLQHYAENAISKGMKETNASSILCLVMDPKTGDVLAMASSPGFDPNNPLEPDSKSEKKAFDKMSDQEQTDYLNKMWRNPMVSDTYEPGSTFKLITASSGLEEGVTSLSKTYVCNVAYEVAGTTLHCWSPRPHGTQTLKEAVGNSCNPAMIQLGMSIGAETYRDYLEMFGITNDGKTGIDLPGEGTAQVQSHIGPVELATMSYGHGVAVTPIQLLSAVSAIGNDGVLMQPRVVKELTDSDGDTVKNFDTKEIRKVISSKTAEEMKEIMEYVVSEGGGGNAKIAGYRIGGKTGTADKPTKTGGYGSDTWSSFIGMAPMDDPQFVMLVVVDSPQGVQFGSSTAAPIAKDFMKNALPYLGINPKYTKEEEKALKSESVYVPNVTDKSYSDAIGILGSYGLKYKVTPKTSSKKDFVVVDQYPKAGKKMKKGGTVYLYRE